MFLKLNKFLIPGILLFFSFLTSYRLFQPGFFSMQDDMHVFRLQQFDQCFRDGQFPCRQIADGGLGYGYPLFNYYSPLPYAVAQIFHILGFSFIDSLKISFAIPNLIRPVSMFLLASAFFGPLGGLISSALYTFAPYLAVDGYVRGALAEYWALSVLPLILYGLYKEKKHIFIISLTLLLLSHNLTTLYFLPVVLIFSTINQKNKFLIKNSIYAFLISSFFIIPAFLEKNLVTVDTMTQGYFSYIIHFATLKQLLLSNYWGYSASQWGPVDGLSLQVGYLLWTLPLAVVLYQIYKRKLNKNIFLFFLIGLFALFLTHNRSTFLWNNLKLLQYYQFPWRFLGLAVLSFSLISGYIIKIVPPRLNKLLTTILIILTIIINLPYFHEDIWYSNITDSQKLSTTEITRQSGAGLKDYWTKSSIFFPNKFADKYPIPTDGQIQTLEFTKNSKMLQGQIFVTSDSATIIFPQSYFPNWQLYINGQSTDYQINPQLGQLQITLPKGDYYFTFRFSNTPLRSIANILSLFGISLYIINLAREKKS